MGSNFISENGGHSPTPCCHSNAPTSKSRCTSPWCRMEWRISWTGIRTSSPWTMSHRVYPAMRVSQWMSSWRQSRRRCCEMMECLSWLKALKRSRHSAVHCSSSATSKGILVPATSLAMWPTLERESANTDWSSLSPTINSSSSSSQRALLDQPRGADSLLWTKAWNTSTRACVSNSVG